MGANVEGDFERAPHVSYLCNVKRRKQSLKTKKIIHN